MSDVSVVRKTEWCPEEEALGKLGLDPDFALVLGDKVFPGQEEAKVHCMGLELGDKVAVVPVMEPKLSNDVVRAIAKLNAKISDLDGKIANHAAIDPETGLEGWRVAIEAEIMARVPEMKSETRGCQACGSKIAVAYIKTIACPVCQAPFLVTESDNKRIRAKEEKLEGLRTERAGLLEQLATVEANGVKASVDYKRVWVAFGHPAMFPAPEVVSSSLEGESLDACAGAEITD